LHCLSVPASQQIEFIPPRLTQESLPTSRFQLRLSPHDHGPSQHHGTLENESDAHEEGARISHGCIQRQQRTKEVP